MASAPPRIQPQGTPYAGAGAAGIDATTGVGPTTTGAGVTGGCVVIGGAVTFVWASLTCLYMVSPVE